MDPDQLMPSTPMTGPSSTGPSPRRLDAQPGPGEEGMPITGDDYVTPADPGTLTDDATATPFMTHFLRRRLDTGAGMRRL